MADEGTSSARPSASWIGKVGGFGAGLVLFLLGYSLLVPDGELAQSGVTVALAAVLTALGIGVMAAAVLPHAIEVSGGEKVKPLGLDVKASGGAAVFLVTLAFIFYMKDDLAPKAAAEQPERVENASGATASDGNAEDDGAEPAVAGEGPAPGDAAALGALDQAGDDLAAEAINPGPVADPYGRSSRPPSGMVRARTYCSYCCNGNPIGCAQVGGGQAYSYLDAATIAYNMCIANEGVPEYCYANLQEF